MSSLGDIRRIYADFAPIYDRGMRLQEGLLLGRLRRRLLGKARGAALEVAIGTGLSLPHYPPGAAVIGLDAAAETLDLATRRAQALGRPLVALVGDAEQLPFPDHSFDTVVSMLSGCTFPDPIAAFREMRRVCRPAGRVLLLEHVRVNRPPIGLLQDIITPYTVRHHGCHQNRDSAANVAAAGLRILDCRPSLGGYLISLEAQP